MAEEEKEEQTSVELVAEDDDYKPTDRLIQTKQVCLILGCSRAVFNKRFRFKPGFPKPHPFSSPLRLKWLESEVIGWLMAHR